MSDELREAAKRWRQFCAKLSGVTLDFGDVDAWVKGITEHWNKYPGGVDQADSDKVTLSSAYLAEHPADDDTPIDEEWIKPLAPHYWMAGDEYSWPSVGVVWAVGHGTGRVLSEGVYLDRGRGCSPAYLDHIKTRGQLRKLLAALGIELKEGKQ